MDTAHPPSQTASAQGPTSAAEERHRAASNAEAPNPNNANQRHQRTLRALADVDTGRLIEDEAMRAWADSLGTDQEMPAPQPR